MPIKNRHFLIVCLILSFFYFSNPVSAFNITPVNTIAINGTATAMSLNGTHFWIADDLGFLYEFDIDFAPISFCPVNTTANNFITYLFYDMNNSNETIYAGMFDPDFNGWTLQIKIFVFDPAPPGIDICDINGSGTWIGLRLHEADAWYYNATENSSIGQWNTPSIAGCQYLHFWQNRTSVTTTRTESDSYPDCLASDPGLIAVAASGFMTPTPTPINMFVVGNDSGVGSQNIHKYNSISFAPIDFNLQYIINTDIDYPDIDRIMALEYLQNGTDRWLYMVNNTHAWRIDIDEFEAFQNNTVDLLSPLNGDVFTISEVTAKYQLSLLDNVTSNIYLDGSLFNAINRSDFESGTFFEAFGNLSSGTHTWGVQLLNQSNLHEFDFPNNTFTIQLSPIEDVAEGVRSALGLADVQSGLTILAFMLMIAVSIGAGGFMFALGGSGEGVGTGFLVTFITSALVLGSIGWLPAWIAITVIVLAGISVAVMMTKSFGGFRGG